MPEAPANSDIVSTVGAIPNRTPWSATPTVSPMGLRSSGSKVTPSVDFTTNDRLNQATGTSGPDGQSPGCTQQPGYSSLTSPERAAKNSLKSNGTRREDPLVTSGVSL